MLLSYLLKEKVREALTPQPKKLLRQKIRSHGRRCLKPTPHAQAAPSLMRTRQSKPLSAPKKKETNPSTPTVRQGMPQAHKYAAAAVALLFALDEIGPLVLIYVYA